MDQLLIKLSFSDCIELNGCGSCSDAINVKGVQYINMSQLEYNRLLTMNPKYCVGYDYGGDKIKVDVTVSQIVDTDFIQKVSGIEEQLSTHHIYKHKPSTSEKRMHMLLDNNSHTELELQEVIGLLENFDWDNLISQKVVNIYFEQYGSEFHILSSIIIANRLFNKYPEVSHMVMLSDLMMFDMDVIIGLVDALLNAGRNIDEIDSFSEEWNLMGYLTYMSSNIDINKRLGLIQYLFLKGSNPNIIFSDGNNLLHLACCSKQEQIINILIQNNVDPFKLNSENEYPIQILADQVGIPINVDNLTKENMLHSMLDLIKKGK